MAVEQHFPQYTEKKAILRGIPMCTFHSNKNHPENFEIPGKVIRLRKLCEFPLFSMGDSELGYLTVRLCARDFYEVIVDEAEGRINYCLKEIESE